MQAWELANVKVKTSLAFMISENPEAKISPFFSALAASRLSSSPPSPLNLTTFRIEENNTNGFLSQTRSGRECEHVVLDGGPYGTDGSTHHSHPVVLGSNLCPPEIFQMKLCV